MLETLSNLGLGFAVALSPAVLLYAFAGCVVGTLVGVLPGVGPLAGISLLLPATFGLDATRAIVMLAGIYYGAMYGGSTTSILMRIPGEAASVMTCIDGYAMARKGRAGAALAIAAVGSYVAGTVSIVALMFLAPPLAEFALRFGPPEYFALLLFGLLVLAYMSGGSMLKALAMAALGLLFGMIGIDQMSGYFRFAYGVVELGDGVGIVPVAVGLFGLAEILATAGQPTPPAVIKPRLRELLPSRREWRASAAPIGRGTVLGFLIGVIPGSAHIISSFVSYAVERRLSRRPEEFGKGAVAGVAGPESANNAATSGAFVPMLALGVPSGPIPAVMLAAMMVHGVSPGPLLIKQQPELFWGFIASMYVGNAVLLILNLPLVGLFVNLLRIPYPILYPAILVFCILGVYAVNGSVVDVWIMLLMGALGYVLRKLDFETAPIVLGVVLAPMIEMALRQSLAMSDGRYAIFATRPISATLLAVAAVLLLLSLKPLVTHTLDWRARLALAEKGEGHP
ncbi:MAG: transporter [Candidatus Rokubacteria bacterium RIFCSPHIGHO2_12_FULL_73_22]|nr:MAG: transporter [Candidatus Rokubacteria bacterium RIFCSPHIGHO2_12_FULL_73_22]OGL10109.1 MAG: transporter [Candidatus Rokubacteria bacterium RIFCSPLOWO2_02_FULL_73_56]